ncbi:MAG: SMP-30/gluconolactonase/LRE family protein [Geminicoccaceae bacterium]
MTGRGFEVVAPTRDKLGESILCHPVDKTLWWIDCFGPTVHRLDPRTGERMDLTIESAKLIGSLTFARGGRLILALDDAMVLFDPATGARQTFSAPEAGRDAVAMNDSKVTRDGKALWAGSYDVGEVEPRGVLWRIGPDGTATIGDAGFAVSNGPSFSPDGRILYFSDSMARRVIAYEILGSRLGPRRILTTLSEEEGVPDGLTVDARGRIWCACYGGGRVLLLGPDGERLDELKVPATFVTSTCLGGEDLKTLYITTGQNPTPGEVDGAVFSCRVDVAGLPEPIFGVA